MNLIFCIFEKKGCVAMSNKNSFLKVELKQEYDVINQAYIEERNVKVDIASIQKGIIKDIGASEFAVLIAIASYSDVDGESFPSQRKLAELTGLSLPTVNKLVNKLLTTEINGVPVLAREFETSGSKKKFSVYSLNTKKVENEESDLKVIFQNESEGVDAPKKKTARDYVALFKHLYEEEFGVKYIINYARDTSLIKKKLMADFEQEQIEAIITYAIKNYKEKWAKPNYPYPTVSMICTWLGNATLQQMEQERAKKQEAEKLQEMTAEYIEADYSAFDRI